MTITVANTANTSTFQYWLSRTNEMAYALSTKVITVESNATTGNAVVNGTFQANVGKFDTLVSNGSTITITSNVYMSNASGSSTLSIGNSSVNLVATSTSIKLGNSSVNVSINSSSILVGNAIVFSSADKVNTNITSSTTVVDSFLNSTYRGADYVVTVKNNSANGHQLSKILVLQNGSTTDALLTEYGVIFSNNQLGVFSANANATHTRLYLTLGTGVTDVQVKADRTLIVV